MTDELLNAVGWAAMVLGTIGALFNVQKQRIGFIFYILANVVMIYVGALKKEGYNVAFFFLMTCISSYGYIKWNPET